MQLDLALYQADNPPEPRVHTVTEVTRRLRELIERGIGELWVEGEISNLRRQSSGHQYFTLKDDTCQLHCVLFGGTAATLPNVRIADGQRVQALGLISVYEPRGQYQMIVRMVQARGAGTLQAKFEALKQKLAAEGLFEPARKRPLPRFPRRLGLVTSPTGAAIRDFLKVLHRRQPGIEVLIYPVRVQGRGASLEIARAIREFGDRSKSRLPAVDAIVITRGGGSIEDLWEFNEEIVARAIAASPVPVLSAIGHEIDFTIADFVADLRAPTPSAAAEILAADRLEVLARLQQHFSRLLRACTGRVELLRARLDAHRRSTLFREPGRRVLELLQTLDRRSDAMTRSVKLRLEREQNRLDRLATRLVGQAPARMIGERRLRCQLLSERLRETAIREITARRARLDRRVGVLHALNPQAILTRGYTITMDALGHPYTTSRAVEAGTLLRTRFHDGEVQSITAKR